LEKRFGDRVALSGISFTVSGGECYGLLGPNGAGKTTAISIVCGLLRTDAGHVTVDGRAITTSSGEATGARAAIGYVPQHLALYPELSAVENLKFFGRLYGLGGKKLAERVASALGVVGLADRGDDKVGSYSGGMQRRANIAAALLHEPRLLVLDEPTVGVDPQSRNAILDMVGSRRAEGVAVLYTTHYMEEAARLCQRIGIIDAGRLVAEGTPRELTDQLGGSDRVKVGAVGNLASLADACSRLGGVEQAYEIDNGVEVVAPVGREVIPAVVSLAAKLDVELSSVEVVEPDLEQVFLSLTGKELRD
jgi:ABC-2 type transport system ATP-binding protein